MSDLTLTQIPAGGRGCGTRKSGGIYGCVGTGPGGILSVYDCLFDPPQPYFDKKFRGIIHAPDEYRPLAVKDDVVMLLDMVSAAEYSVASFMEEGRRFGFSRRFPSTFDFASLTGKKVYLCPVHWQAIPKWWEGEELTNAVAESLAATTLLPLFDFALCSRPAQDHYIRCVYHLWPLSSQHHEQSSDDLLGFVHGGPSFTFDTLSPIRDHRKQRGKLWTRVQEYPEPSSYIPGIVAAIPITHFEVVDGVPEDADTNLMDSELPVVTRSE